MIEYFFIINSLALLLYALDKIFAIKHRSRIPERTLLAIGIFGGCIGAFLGMILFHHKTKKKKFQIVNFLSLLLWIIIIIGGYRS